MARASLAVAALSALLVLAPAASASGWYPHPADATWSYQWTDSTYATVPTTEKVTVSSQKGDGFVLAWTTEGLDNPDGSVPTAGTMTFQETPAGLFAVDWSSTPPPSTFPILCASASQCGNSLSSALYNLVWGSRSPVLVEPLLQGTSWASTGGAQNDVTSGSDYLGTEEVSVPAFPKPVVGAKVRTEITQAGAIGDPYGSGIRTVWWAYGVGPVKIELQHAGGAVTTVQLTGTNQTPQPPPTDVDYFPLVKNLKLTYRWTNTKWLKKPSVQQVTISQVANGSARLDVKHVSGPIHVAGAYGFTRRASGITNLWATTKSASLASFPALGPRSLPKGKRRHFATPLDLMVYGFNPILPGDAIAGSNWSAKIPSRDWSVFGVKGKTTVLGVRRIKVPAGRFDALAVRSTLTQPGFAFGSGTRTMWFAPGEGLVKLVFRHADRSVSTVVLTK